MVSCKLFLQNPTIQIIYTNSNKTIFAAGAMLAALNTDWPAVLALFRSLVAAANGNGVASRNNILKQTLFVGE
jgi:hypothetical protein